MLVLPSAPLRTLACGLAFTSFTLGTLAVSAPAASLWPPDSTASLPVCRMPGYVQNPLVVSDGANGLITLWTDYRTGNLSNADLYARHVDFLGDTLWQGNGTPVCTFPGNQLSPALIADGAHGAIACWIDVGQGGIYAQRMSADGTAKWHVNGASVSTSYSSSNPPYLAADGASGAFVIWAPGTGSLLAQHVDSLGAKWGFFPPQQGITLRTSGNPGPRGAVSDGSNGAIVAVGSTSGANSVVSVQHINLAQAGLWGANGVDLAAFPSAVIGSIVPDGAGGAIVAWEDRRNGSSNADIFVQRVSSAGAPQWTANGVPVCTAANGQSLPVLRALADGGVVVAWKDTRTNLNGDLYAQRLDASGAPMWTADGVPIATGISAAPTFGIVAGDGDSTFVCWNSTALFNGDVFAQQLVGTGTRLFGPAGVAICRGPSTQLEASFLSDGMGGVYAVFDDSRTGDDDIAAQHAGADGVAGPGVLAVPSLPQTGALAIRCGPIPWRSQLRIALAGTSAAPARVEVFDLAGRRRWSASLAAGASAVEWDGRDERGMAVEPGVFRVRVTRGGEAGFAAAVHLR